MSPSTNGKRGFALQTRAPANPRRHRCTPPPGASLVRRRIRPRTCLAFSRFSRPRPRFLPFSRLFPPPAVPSRPRRTTEDTPQRTPRSSHLLPSQNIVEPIPPEWLSLGSKSLPAGGSNVQCSLCFSPRRPAKNSPVHQALNDPIDNTTTNDDDILTYPLSTAALLLAPACPARRNCPPVE